MPFVESDLELRWSWPPGLSEDQLFAVQVWYGEEAPHEIWTHETSLNVQDAIDSYVRDLGTYSWKVAVIQVSAKDGFQGMGSEWSSVQKLQRVRRLSPTPYPENQQSAAARLVKRHAFYSMSSLIEYARDFVSTHSDSSQQAIFAPDFGDALDMMVDYENGQGLKPRLECDGQATALLTLLKQLGIESRLIFLYSDDEDTIAEHTLLEVFNPETQHWEVHDVLYNLSFVDANRERVSIERLVFSPTDTVSVCDTGGACKPLNPGYTNRHFLEAFRYGFSDTFWVNAERFNLAKRFPGNRGANLAEYLTGNARDFVFRLGP